MDSYFTDGSMLRRVHRELAVAFSGPRALLMQATHPVAFEGFFAHGGYEPFYPFPADGSTPKTLASLRKDCEVINTKHGSVICKWFFSRTDGTLLGFETYIAKDGENLEDRDPCELYFYDYKDVGGRKLPHKIEVRHRDKLYATLTVSGYKFDK